MKEAAEKLEKGDSAKGLELQKEAQKLLEKARDIARGEDEPQPQPNGPDGNKLNPDEKLDIPDANAHKGPDAFRKRVLEGLGSGASSPKLQDAVKRYAEGLVK